MMVSAPTGTRVDVTDKAGYKAILGTVSIITTPTGETHQKTAASLTMYDDEDNLIAEVP